MRILLVEDDATFRETLARALEKRGVDVVAAGAIDEAASYLEEGRFDAVVADLRVGRESGAAQLATATACVRVLISGGSPTTDERATDDASLRKPFDADDLLAVIETAHRSVIDR